MLNIGEERSDDLSVLCCSRISSANPLPVCPSQLLQAHHRFHPHAPLKAPVRGWGAMVVLGRH